MAAAASSGLEHFLSLPTWGCLQKPPNQPSTFENRPQNWHRTKHWQVSAVVSTLLFSFGKAWWQIAAQLPSTEPGGFFSRCGVFSAHSFLQVTHHSWQGNALRDRAALPARPSPSLPGWERIPPTEQFSPTNQSFSPGASSFWRLILTGHSFTWAEITIYFHKSSLLGLFQVSPSGLRERLLLVTGHWCCCWELNLRTNPLYPKVSHFRGCRTSFDLKSNIAFKNLISSPKIMLLGKSCCRGKQNMSQKMNRRKAFRKD